MNTQGKELKYRKVSREKLSFSDHLMPSPEAMTSARWQKVHRHLPQQWYPPLFFFFNLLATPHRDVGSLFPLQGSNPHLLLWKCGVLTTGFPGEGPERKFRHRQTRTVGKLRLNRGKGKMAFYQPGEKTQKKVLLPPCPHTDLGLVVSRTVRQYLSVV